MYPHAYEDRDRATASEKVAKFMIGATNFLRQVLARARYGTVPYTNLQYTRTDSDARP